MNINFNLGNGQAATEELAKICKQYYQCEGCPVDKNGGLIIDGIKATCSTQIIKNILRKAGKNV